MEWKLNECIVKFNQKDIQSRNCSPGFGIPRSNRRSGKGSRVSERDWGLARGGRVSWDILRRKEYLVDTPVFTYCSSWIFHFLQIEGKTLHQQKDGNSLYCDAHFFAVVWKQTCNTLDVYLCPQNKSKGYRARKVAVGLIAEVIWWVSDLKVER